MSPPPVRSDWKANTLPSGEYRGRDSLAACDTSSRASPPAIGTDQMSPPEPNAISERSGEIAGSVKYGRGSTEGGDVCWTGAVDALTVQQTTASRLRRRTWRMGGDPTLPTGVAG